MARAALFRRPTVTPRRRRWYPTAAAAGTTYTKTGLGASTLAALGPKTVTSATTYTKTGLAASAAAALGGKAVQQGGTVVKTGLGATAAAALGGKTVQQPATPTKTGLGATSGAPAGSKTVIWPTTSPISDSFDSYPLTAWAEGTTHGPWYVNFAGGGQIIPAAVAGDGVLQLESASGITNTGDTASQASLVTSTTSTAGDIALRARMRTVAQLRSGYSPPGTPNGWEVAWLIWNYTEPGSGQRRFYYVALKTNGFELGKVDQSIALPGGQRFLWTDSTPFSIGTWYDVLVQQAGSRIQVWVDGVSRADFTDGVGSGGTPAWGTTGEVVMTSGAVGLYHEDARAQFTDVRAAGGVAVSKTGVAAGTLVATGPARITTGPLWAGSEAGVSGTWVNTAGAVGGTLGDFATWTDSSSSASATLEAATFGAYSVVPNGAPVDLVSVSVRHSESPAAQITGVVAQAYRGAVAYGSAQPLTVSATVHDDVITLSGLTYADLSDLRVRVTATRVAPVISVKTGTAAASGAAAGVETVQSGALVIAGVSSDGTHFVDQYGQPRLLIGEDSWLVLANGGLANGGNYQSTFDTYFAQRAAQGYTAIETVWCSFPAVSPGTEGNTDGSDWDGVYPFATQLNPTTAANSTFWARRDYFFASAAANGITVIMNMSTTMLSLADPDVQQRGWTTAQWQAFGTFIGNRYKNTPNILWIVGDDYFGDFDTQLSAWLTSLRATGDTHPVSIQLYQEATSRQDLSTLAKDPLAFSVHAQYEWVYTYNVSYDGIERAQNYVPTASDDVQHVVPPVWGDGFYIASGTGTGQTDVRLERQMIWWALSSGACGVSTGDNEIWTWSSTAAATVTGKTFYTAVMPAIAAAFGGLTGWHQLAPDTSSQLVTAGRGTHASAIASGGGGTPYIGNTDNYVTASRTPDTGSGSSLAVIYCGKAFTITIDQTKMKAGYTVTWIDPVSGATFAGTSGSTYNSATARGNNSAGDPDWVLVLRG